MSFDFASALDMLATGEHCSGCRARLRDRDPSAAEGKKKLADGGWRARGQSGLGVRFGLGERLLAELCLLSLAATAGLTCKSACRSRSLCSTPEASATG